jgi:hypothetical protein
LLRGQNVSSSDKAYAFLIRARLSPKIIVSDIGLSVNPPIERLKVYNAKTG